MSPVRKWGEPQTEGRMVDADKLIEWLRKMRHRHDMDHNGTLVWVERQRVIDLIDWVACGENMEEFRRLREERTKNGNR